MDENKETTPAPEVAPVASLQGDPLQTPSPRKWLILGGAVAVVLLLAGAGVFGYQKYLASQQTQPTPSAASELPPAPPPVPGESTTSEAANWKTYTSVQLANNSLKPYSIQYPESWKLDVKRDPGVEALTLTKEGYTISIFQAAYGGAGCIFDGTVPEGPYEDLRDKKYIQIESGVGKLRRFAMDPSRIGNPDTAVFDFCAETDNGFTNPTSVGDINYTVPKNYSESVLREMDSILETLKKA